MRGAVHAKSRKFSVIHPCKQLKKLDDMIPLSPETFSVDD